MKRVSFFTILFLFVISTYLNGQPTVNRIWQYMDSVGLYDKFELSLRIDSDYENPFDPEQIDIMVTFTAPSGKEWKIPGFYNQLFQRTENMPKADYGGMFTVRFSPNETGMWNYVVRVIDKNGEAESESGSFKAVESTYHGPIQIAENKRYLQQADGTPWYGVGMWFNGVRGGKKTQEDILDELKERGVNFICRLNVPLETWGTGLGRYDQLICSRIDELLTQLEERDMQLAFEFWHHSFLSETVWGSGNIAWYTIPYSLVTECKDFYSSDEAWKYQEKLYRYIIARWGYSRSLAIWLIVDEVNGTDGWASGDSLGAANWGKKVHDYLKANDPWQHLTTGTRSGGLKQWWQEGYEIFDMAGREIYEAQGFPINRTGYIDKDDTHPLTYSYRNYHGEMSKVWHGFEKPAIIPETGWDHTFYEMSMPGYKAQYHNACWASLASGAAMSPFWFSYSGALNDNVVTYDMLSYRRFTDEIPWSTLTNVAPVEIKNSDGDAYAMGSDQVIFGWAVNAEADMTGKTITIPKAGKGKYKLRLYHTWRGRFLTNEDRTVMEQVIESKGKSVSFEIPVYKVAHGHARYIGQDIAFILEPAN